MFSFSFPLFRSFYLEKIKSRKPFIISLSLFFYFSNTLNELEIYLSISILTSTLTAPFLYPTNSRWIVFLFFETRINNHLNINNQSKELFMFKSSSFFLTLSSKNNKQIKKKRWLMMIVINIYNNTSVI